MLKRLLIASFCLMAISAYGFTGRELLPLCKEAVAVADAKGKNVAADRVDIGMCLGYVESVADFNVLFTAAKFSSAVTYCPPEGTTIENDIRVIVQYFDTHPKELAAPANIPAMRALREAFPCKK